MNTLGIALAWCIVQVTLFSLLAGVLYLLLRRLRPAAAAPIVQAGLVMVVLLSFMALSPWPRWNLYNLIQSADKSPLASGASGGDLREGEDSFLGADRLKSAPDDALVNPSVDAAIDAPAEASDAAKMQSPMPSVEETKTPLPEKKPFFQSLLESLSTSSETASATGWRWPEIFATVLLSIVGIGFLWLLLGVAAVRRQKLRSRPVDDRALLELIDVLRAELSCRRPIEVRQSDELVTAATIGWRQPVLLLPSDWTSWTADQCRAVLAHEIAHARSHDFLALLCGQLGLMLHFYHPIVHWLVNRLRLEQELAADAAAASISGGQRQYLTTIAELALRQQDRPLTWPARTFLPTRNTFLRRIAMLRDSKLHFERLSPTARTLTVSIIVLSGMLVAGLRGPVGPKSALAEVTPLSTTATDKDAAVEKDKDKDKDPAATPKSENILSNPGMEKGDEYAEDWLQGNSIEGVKYSWDKNVASEGKASLCIEKSINRFFPVAGWSQTVDRTGDLPFLEVSAQVKSKKMFKAILDVIFLDKNDQWISHEWAAYIGSKETKDPPANHDWKKYTGTVKIPDNTAKITVSLQDYGPGKVWFDDVQARYVKTKPATPAAETKKAAEEKPAEADKINVTPPATQKISAMADDSTKPSLPTGKMETLSYVGESSKEMMSWADSGYAVLFERPADLKSINAVKLYGARYGTPRPPNEKFHIYLLDEKQKVLEHILVPYAKVQRGDMKWFTFEFPAIEVPQKFYVALWFDAEATKGVYVGKDMNVPESHSWSGLPDKGYHKVEGNYDWMIRADVSDDNGKKPSYPKVKTYEEENASEEEIGEVSAKRIWNDASGAFTLEAEFVGVADGKVSLKKADGKTISVPLTQLSKEDQDFIAQQADAKKPSNGGNDKTTELSHDDGKMSGKRSIAGGGHAVQFEVDGNSYYVTSVSLHGSRYGTPRPPEEKFNVWICDEHFKPIATFHFPYGSYARAEPVWKSFKVNPTKVPKKFIVCFGFNPHQTKGVFVSYDAEGTGNSFVGVPGQSEPEIFDQGDWLIRCKVEKR